MIMVNLEEAKEIALHYLNVELKPKAEMVLIESEPI